MMQRFQISNATGYMRYAEFYSALSRHLVVSKRPKVMIFGCSTGEELRTANTFWPDGRIFGCDITEELLAQCRRVAPFATVFISTFEAIREHGPYDLVCANSVLCRHPFPAGDYASELPLTMFERFVSELIEVTAYDGHLMLYNTNYFVNDLDLASALTPIIISSSWTGSFVPRVDKKGRMVARPIVVDSILQRYHMLAEWQSVDHIAAALFQRCPGSTRRLDCSDLLDTGATFDATARASFPQDFAEDAYLPVHFDTVGDQATIRTTFVHNPLFRRWQLHGTTVQANK